MDKQWASGDAYERYMGRWSRLVAERFLAWLNVPPGRAWLDVGCGPGTLTRLILRDRDPASVTALDSSPGFIEHAARAVPDPRARFQVGLAQSLELESGSFDVVVSGLVLNFVPQPAAAAAEMLRVARPGGTVAAFVWDYAEGMQMLRRFWDAAGALDPAARALDEGPLFPVCRAGGLERLFHAAGLRELESTALTVETRFRDFDDYWLPFLNGTGPAYAYASGLPEDARDRLRERLRASLPVEPDGSIPLTARAWAVRGVR
jgi:SAM-dependent methyltransferase